MDNINYVDDDDTDWEFYRGTGTWVLPDDKGESS